jgi:hypothetical protein
VGKRITDWLRTTYEAISPLPQHFPFFRWLKKEEKNRGRGGVGERRREAKKSQKKIARCWGSGEKWSITLWHTGAYSLPHIFPSISDVGEVGEVV